MSWAIPAPDTDFDAGGDDIEYEVSVPDSEVLNVEATLVYQPLAYGHLQDLFDSAEVPSVNYFQTLFESASLKSEVITSDSVQVSAN